MQRGGESREIEKDFFYASQIFVNLHWLILLA